MLWTFSPASSAHCTWPGESFAEPPLCAGVAGGSTRSYADAPNFARQIIVELFWVAGGSRHDLARAVQRDAILSVVTRFRRGAATSLGTLFPARSRGTRRRARDEPLEATGTSWSAGRLRRSLDRSCRCSQRSPDPGVRPHCGRCGRDAEIANREIVNWVAAAPCSRDDPCRS